MRREQILTLGVDRLRVNAIIGIFLRERHVKQPLWIAAKLSIRRDGNIADEIGATLDYNEIVRAIKAEAARSFHILEALGDAILDRLLSLDPKAFEAEVEIRKPKAIKEASCAFVRMNRKKQSKKEKIR
jgi:dihydroneopterin aldolase